MNNSRMNVFDESIGASGSWRALTPGDLAGTGGGGGGGDASAANQLALAAVIGATDDAPWDGVAADATLVSLLKAVVINTAAVVVV